MAGDFATTNSSPRSSPQAVISTDARTVQYLISPQFNFIGKYVHSLSFYERRSSSHASGLLIEAILNNDTNTVLLLSDTLKLVNSTSYVAREILLPSQLNNHPNVRFRWRVTGTGGPTSGSGTIRFDDIFVTVEKAVDLSLTSFRVSPTKIRSGVPAELMLGITNLAKAGAFSFSVSITDSARGGIQTIYNRVHDVVLSASDSLVVSVPVESFRSGAHTLTAHIFLPSDEDTSNNDRKLARAIGYPAGSIKINEFMYTPSDGREWVECINASADTIDLTSWKIADRSTTVLLSPSIILPFSFFVVAKDTTFIDRFPSVACPIVKASLPSLNNDSDAVVLTDPAGWMCDSLSYHSTWGGTGGMSLERIDTAEGTSLSSNWGSCTSLYGATPGMENSIAIKNYDLAVSSIRTAPAAPVAGQPLSFDVIVKNRGRSAAGNFILRFFADANRDSLLQPDEVVGERSYSALPPRDSIEAIFSVPSHPSGSYLFAAGISFQVDEKPENNFAFIPVTVGASPGSIIINEIMYAPPGDIPEWIEVYNATDDPINVAGWKISDAGTTRAYLRNTALPIAPHSYAMITTDSSFVNFYSVATPVYIASFSALNNTTPDAVVLFDQRGIVMDSVWYKPSWGGSNGKTLERIDYFSSSNDSLNWTSGPPTPGGENPSAKKDYDLTMSSLFITASGSSIHITGEIKNCGRKPVDAARLYFFYDFDNDSMIRANEAIDSSASIALIFPSNTATISYDWPHTIRGMVRFAAAVRSQCDQRSSNDTIMVLYSFHYQSESIVINEIMYEPRTSQSEFFELFNRSADTVNLQNWKFRDTPTGSGSRTSITFTQSSFFLFPGEYCTIASDSSILSQYPLANDSGNKLIIVNKDFGLGNSGDDIILFDHTEYCIDSIRFSPLWHLKSLTTPGRSLERINSGLSGNDSRNWSSCVAPAGATPCMPNSIFTPVQKTDSRISLSPNPFSPDGDGTEDFLTISYSLPSRSSMIRVRCFDVHGRLIRTLANNEPIPSEGIIIWDGYDDQHRRVRMGMYILLFEALDNFGGTVTAIKEVAVVAGKL